MLSNTFHFCIVVTYFLFYRNEYVKKTMGCNFTQEQSEKFKKDHIGKSRLPRGLVEALFERLKRTVDTTNMDANGLSTHLSRRKNFNKIKVWEEAAEEEKDSEEGD